MRLCSLAIFSVLLSGCALTSPNVAYGEGNQNVCMLIAAPTTFDQKLVRVRARVVSDGIHSTGLIDEGCSSKGVAFVVPTESSNDPGVEKVMHAIYGQLPFGVSASKKRIMATVKGTFVWRPNEMPERQIIVESVSNVEVLTTKREN